ncbi:PCFT-like protein [Mya arenaria]|uniref:PCFT-like protein n=1 Tax=Mya arenaria TaxID=6604 RepID=A0ABY7F8X9_MYAAR|nr:proton-coupled folate transporter-like [Mya arenaria]XP_052768585.1 proton-coupled folate transporter-like [Mya arenaria]XP_052768588.1 proton-coupled folate transporter-like [Mya arenaria]WAR18643.1 PCFT-like protein [Mya arenaria]
MSGESSTGCMQRTHAMGLVFLDSIQSYLVEAAYFLFFLARHMTLPLFQEYVQQQTLAKRHLHAGLDIDSTPLNETQLYHEAQRESAVVVLSLQIAEGLPAVVTVIILGALSDRTGRRRILLWLPALGSSIYCFIYIMIQYTGWSIDGLFMASAIRGLSGSMTAVLAGGSYYAINVVKPHQRSSRLALQELLNGAAYALGNIMVGFWVQASGFLQPFWFCFICSLASLLISFFLVREVKPESNRSPSRQEMTGNCCIDTFKPLGRFFKCKNNIKLVRVWLAILAFQTYAIVHIGQINTLVLYLLGPPLNWEATKIGVFLSVAMACAAICTGTVTPVLKRYFPFFTETHIALMGFVSKLTGTLWIAGIHNGVILYVAIFLLIFELLPFPMMRAIVAQGIEPAQQGSLFALMHSGESISYFLAPLMFQSIYADTLRYYAGFVFVVSALLLILPFGLTLGIRYIDLHASELGYEVMEGKSELIANEVPVDSSQPDQEEELTPRIMTTSLSGNQPDITAAGTTDTV